MHDSVAQARYAAGAQVVIRDGEWMVCCAERLGRGPAPQGVIVCKAYKDDTLRRPLGNHRGAQGPVLSPGSVGGLAGGVGDF